jgi:hypothetical protein
MACVKLVAHLFGAQDVDVHGQCVVDAPPEHLRRKAHL